MMSNLLKKPLLAFFMNIVVFASEKNVETR